MSFQSSDKLGNIYCWTAKPIASSPVSFMNRLSCSLHTVITHTSDVYTQYT